jgi:hypothetical protein
VASRDADGYITYIGANQISRRTDSIGDIVLPGNTIELLNSAG